MIMSFSPSQNVGSSSSEYGGAAMTLWFANSGLLFQAVPVAV